MGDHLNRMKKIMDEHISLGSVFTEKDEQNILRKIHEKLPVSKKRPFIPALLTVALFAGLLIVTYSYFDNLFEPSQQAVENKKEVVKEEKEMDGEKEVKEDKPKEFPVDYDKYFNSPLGEVEINKGTDKLQIFGGFINLAKEESPQFSVKVDILNPNLEGVLKEMAFYFEDARNVKIMHDEVFQFRQEVPLLSDIKKEDLENQVQLSFIVEKKVVKTHVIENIHVIEEEQVSDEENKMTVEKIKQVLKIGLSQKEVIALFGDKYTAVEGASNNQNYWRFDIGADPDYTFSTDDRLADSIDQKGLLDGTVDTILFVEWDENLKVNSFSFYNLLEYGFMYSYRVFPDGTVKEDRADDGGIE
jgi:hypothetical protein